MKPLLSILFVCFSLCADAEDFTNWYFALHSKPYVVSGSVESADGTTIGSFVGISTGQENKEASTFTEEFEYTFLPSKVFTTFKMVWKKDEDGIYRASAVASDGVQFKVELEILSDTIYRLKFDASNGTTSVTEGKLGKNNTIQTRDRGFDSSNKLFGVMTYTQSRNLEVKKELENKPAEDEQYVPPKYDRAGG